MKLQVMNGNSILQVDDLLFAGSLPDDESKAKKPFIPAEDMKPSAG
jgi:hypothetical protein